MRKKVKDMPRKQQKAVMSKYHTIPKSNQSYTVRKTSGQPVGASSSLSGAKNIGEKQVKKTGKDAFVDKEVGVVEKQRTDLQKSKNPQRKTVKKPTRKKVKRSKSSKGKKRWFKAKKKK